MTGASTAIEVSSVRGATEARGTDAVAVEEPLEIQLCSATATGAAARSISITMRTPGDDADLALGFLYTEGIIHAAGDIVAAAATGEVDARTGLQNRMLVELDPAVDIDLERLQRHFYTTSSCGVCGKASIDALRVVGCEPPGGTFHIVREVLARVPEALRKRQQVFEDTGGLHAAAAFNANGEIVVVREDVGRHNAVDKVVGSLLRDGRLPASDLGLMVSGRASFELTQKALVAGMPLIAAVSAPSSLAVQLAREFHMTLIGFLRGDRFNIYSGPERIGGQAA